MHNRCIISTGVDRVSNHRSHPERRFRTLKRIENAIEIVLFSGRWLLAPLYLGLLAGLVVLVFKFGQAFWHLVSSAPDSSLKETTLAILEVLDIALLGNLIMIVIFSGYENFVSKISVAEGAEDRPSWMGKVDFSGLKLKLIGSLVAISVIQLLAIFLEPENMDTDKLFWMIMIHLTFVVSGVLFAVMDYISDKRATVELQAGRALLELRILEKQHGFGQGYAEKMNPTHVIDCIINTGKKSSSKWSEKDILMHDGV